MRTNLGQAEDKKMTHERPHQQKVQLYQNYYGANTCRQNEKIKLKSGLPQVPGNSVDLMFLSHSHAISHQ